MLWNLTIANYMSDQLSVFVEIEFGGSREECKVHVSLWLPCWELDTVQRQTARFLSVIWCFSLSCTILWAAAAAKGKCFLELFLCVL